MQRKMVYWIISIGTTLLLSSTSIATVTAFYQQDPLNDVMTSAGSSGDYIDPIDVQESWIHGSSIHIITESDLALLNAGVPSYFICLFNEDGDPTNFEAALIYFYTPNTYESVYWTLDNPFDDKGVEWEIDNKGAHSQYSPNEIILTFTEFEKIGQSSLLVITYAEDGMEYYDWVPNVLHSSTIVGFSSAIISSVPTPIKPPSSTTPSTTTTTILPTTTSLPTTSPPTSTSTTVDTNPIIIPTDTTTDSYATDTTDEDPRPSDITPGYSLIPILISISLMVICRYIKRGRK